MQTMPANGLYAITDCDNLQPAELLERSAAILANGAAMLQYRNKLSAAAEKHALAEKLQNLCQQFHVPFIVNDDIDLALALQADGLHIGKSDGSCRAARARLGPQCIIGVSCYNDLQRARDAATEGATYVAFGAFHETRSKQATVTADSELLRTARQTISLPIVAIGGINPANAAGLLSAGADFLAVISALYGNADAATATRQFVKLFTQE